MVEQFGRRHGLAVDIALDMADVEPPDQVELVERFDTLGGRFHLERLGQRDDRGDDRAVARPRLGRAANEALVDLDLVERRRLPIAERRIAGAEIVEREADARLLQRLVHTGRYGTNPTENTSRYLQFAPVAGNPRL